MGLAAQAKPKSEAERQEKIAALFEQYKPMAVKFAGDFSRWYGVPYDETLEEAEWILSRCAAAWYTEGDRYEYKPVCNPTSWMYRNFYWELTTHCTRKRPREKARPFSELGTEERPLRVEAKAKWLESLMADLGEDAKIVIKTILQCPQELAADLTPRTGRKRAKGAVCRYLEKLGWGRERAESAWDEVSVCLT